MPNHDTRKLIQDVLQTRMQKSMREYLQARAGLYVLQDLQGLELQRWIDSDTADCLLMDIASGTLCADLLEVKSDGSPSAIGSQTLSGTLPPPTDRIAVPEPEPESAKKATSTKPKKSQPAQRSQPAADGAKTCPVCGIPIGAKSMGCRKHYQQVKKAKRQTAHLVDVARGRQSRRHRQDLEDDDLDDLFDADEDL